MKVRFTFFICLAFFVGCMWQSCSNDDSIALPEQEREELTMKDVLQIYLDAGFEIDSTATPKGDTFDTPEEALKALEEWQNWKVANDIATRSTGSAALHKCKLYEEKIPNRDNRYLYYFLYRQFQVSFATGPNGKVSFDTLYGAFYGDPLPCVVIETQPMAFTGALDEGGRDISFYMHTEICAHFESFGFRIKEDHLLINSYCTTFMDKEMVQVVDISAKAR